MGRSCGNLKRDYEQLYWLVRQKGNVIEFYHNGQWLADTKNVQAIARAHAYHLMHDLAPKFPDYTVGVLKV